MNWVDLGIVGIILFSAIISVYRGFIKEVLSLVNWVLAISIASLFAGQLSLFLEPYFTAAFLEPTFSRETVRLTCSFIILFIVTLILGALISNLLSTLVEKTGISGTDRTLGIVFGLLRGGIVVVILVLISGLTFFPETVWWQNSLLVGYFQDYAIKVSGFLPDEIANNLSF